MQAKGMEKKNTLPATNGKERVSMSKETRGETERMIVEANIALFLENSKGFRG